MSAQVQGTLLDVLKKKMRQTKEEMEKYKDECEEYQRRLQVEVMRREETVSKKPPNRFNILSYKMQWQALVS
ncbi:Tropomyosin-1, isoforms 9A/A/B [Acromyrmex echinatior]|uniref:Tropomyosin-1, isoforms 9A/A/B n=1 Tax=Acromyrmex echinatior TaxID=103372 RepID=F4WSG6_ACREC|nr:Tropomyosin-1, isoforms 9A/A/B [Acromyrmex echinatior]